MIPAIIISFFAIGGTLFIAISALGLLRFPDIYTRMHAAAKAASLGLGMLLIAAAVASGELEAIIKSILTILFVFMTAPVASHLMSRAAYRSNVPSWGDNVVDELKGTEQDHQASPDAD